MPSHGKINITFDEQGKASVNMSGRVPKNTQEHVQELMGWMSKQPNAPMGRPKHDPSSTNTGQLATQDQLLKQDAAGAGHITPAEQSEPAMDSEIKEISGEFHGSVPLRRETAKPITAGSHALSNTNDDGKHVQMELGSTSPVTDDMQMVDAGMMEPQLEPGQEKEFQRDLSDVRTRLDRAIEIHDHSLIRSIHKEFAELRAHYKEAIETQRMRNEITHYANMQAHAQQQQSADSIAPTPQEHAQDTANNPDTPPQDPVLPPPTSDLDQKLQEHGSGAVNSMAGMAQEMPEMMQEEEEPEQPPQQQFKSFFPMFFDLSKGIKGSSGSKLAEASAATEHVSQSRKLEKKEKSSPRMHRYIKRWWNNGRWNYQYYTPGRGEKKKLKLPVGAGKVAMQSAAKLEPHLIEVHDSVYHKKQNKVLADYMDGAKPTKSQEKKGKTASHFGAAGAYYQSIKALSEEDPGSLSWTETDSNGKHYVFRQRQQRQKELHQEKTDEKVQNPGDHEFKEEHEESLAGYGSHSAIAHAIDSWNDVDNKPWLVMHSFPSKRTMKVKDRATGKSLGTVVKNQKVYEITEVEGNEKGIAGQSEFNKVKFTNEGSAKRAAAFITAYHRSENSNEPVAAFADFGKGPVETKFNPDTVMHNLERGRIKYEAQALPEHGIYRLRPVISNEELKAMVRSRAFQGLYKNAVYRATKGFLIATSDEKGKGVPMTEGTVDFLKIDKNDQGEIVSTALQENFVLDLLTITHVPGKSGFMKGYVPGNNLWGYLANALAHRQSFGGALVNRAVEEQGLDQRTHSGDVKASKADIQEEIRNRDYMPDMTELADSPEMQKKNNESLSEYYERVAENAAPVGEEISGLDTDDPDYVAPTGFINEANRVDVSAPRKDEPYVEQSYKEELKDMDPEAVKNTNVAASAWSKLGGSGFADADEAADIYTTGYEDYETPMKTGDSLSPMVVAAKPGAKKEAPKEEAKAPVDPEPEDKGTVAWMKWNKKQQRLAKQAKKSLEGAKEEDSDDVEGAPMAIGENSGVPGTEVIRRSLYMDQDTEDHLMSLVKSIYDAHQQGEIDDSLIKANPAYEQAVEMLEIRKRSRMMKSAAYEVATSGWQFHVLSGIVDASFEDDVAKGISDVIGVHSPLIAEVLECSDADAKKSILEAYQSLKAHPFFKSAFYMTLSSEWAGEPEEKMFRGFARESLKGHFINNGGGQPKVPSAR